MTPDLQQRIEAFCRARFERGAAPRSEAYQQGFRCAVERQLTPAESRHLVEKDVPHRAGTAEWDAWFAGFDEGRERAKFLLESMEGEA